MKMKFLLLVSALLVSVLLLCDRGMAVDLKAGDGAPLFSVKTHEGKDFNLKDRKGQWTVLYFYPKAETPGCTKQACAFRDSIKKVRDLGADVFGISTDEGKALSDFHTNHHLNFVLLSDPKAEVTNAYGAKMPIVKIAKRWTFIIDPELKIKNIDNNVDPVKDADNVANMIRNLQAK